MIEVITHTSENRATLLISPISGNETNYISWVKGGGFMVSSTVEMQWWHLLRAIWGCLSVHTKALFQDLADILQWTFQQGWKTRPNVSIDKTEERI